VPNFDLASLKPAKHVDEPPAVKEGWKASDLDDDELVDDTFIVEDSDNDLDVIEKF
jgi:hypothetical protein